MTVALPVPFLTGAENPDGKAPALAVEAQQNFDTLKSQGGGMRVSGGDNTNGPDATVSSAGTGLYTITFTTPFAVTPAIVVTASHATEDLVVTIRSASATAFTFQIVRRSDGAAWAAICFWVARLAL